MSDKYIIKNCPALYQINGMTNECLGTDYQCQDSTDCVLKKIVELCKGAFKWKYADTAHDAQLRYAKAEFANELLSKLDIQECESENSQD